MISAALCFRTMTSKRKNTPTKLLKEHATWTQSSVCLNSDLQIDRDLHVTRSAKKQDICVKIDASKDDSEDVTVTVDNDLGQERSDNENRPVDNHDNNNDELSNDKNDDIKDCTLAGEVSSRETSTQSDNHNQTAAASVMSSISLASASPTACVTGPYACHRRSMDTVLKRLNPNITSVSLEMALTSVDFCDSPNVMDAVHAVLAGDGTLIEKEQQIGEIISHLQNIRQNLSKQKSQVTFFVPNS